MATKVCLLLAASIVSWSGEETPEPTVERSARDFRIHTYNNYRTQRSEYDRRVKASAELESRWRAFEQHRLQPDEPEAFLKWYQDALTLSQQAVLPEIPAGPQVPPPPRKEISVSAPAIQVPNFLAPKSDDVPPAEPKDVEFKAPVTGGESPESSKPQADSQDRPTSELADPKPMDVVGDAPADPLQLKVAPPRNATETLDASK